MKIIKPLAVTMAVIMLMPMLMSCSSAKKSVNVVKEDDPWYETTRFKINKAIGENDEYSGKMCTSCDRVFSLYSYSSDRWGSAKAKIDTYDLDGNLYKSLPDG